MIAKKQIEKLRERIASEVWCCSINLETQRKGDPIQFLPPEFAEQELIDKQPYYDTANQILLAIKEAGLKFVPDYTIKFSTPILAGTETRQIEEIEIKEVKDE